MSKERKLNEYEVIADRVHVLQPWGISVIPGTEVHTHYDLSPFEGIYVKRKGTSVSKEDDKNEESTKEKEMLVDSPENTEGMKVVEEKPKSEEKPKQRRGPGRPRKK